MIKKLTPEYRKILFRDVHLNWNKYREPNLGFLIEPEYLLDVAIELDEATREAMNSGQYSTADNDLYVAKLLYEGLPSLERRVAADPLFWDYLSHVTLFKYVATRFRATTLGSIRDHWFTKKRGSLLRHSLAGLWWGVHQTIDVDEETNNGDKYHLTKVLFTSSELRTRTLMTYQMSRNKEVVKAVLKFIRDNPEHFQNNVATKYDKITKHLSILGGSRPLIVFDEDMIKQELENIFAINQNNGTV
jgi:hypothetical protein